MGHVEVPLDRQQMLLMVLMLLMLELAEVVPLESVVHVFVAILITNERKMKISH